jgi:hypothetical protein
MLMYLQKVQKISKQNLRRKIFVDVLKVLTKIAGSGSISQRYGSADPDPYQISWIDNTALKNYRTGYFMLIIHSIKQ